MTGITWVRRTLIVRGAQSTEAQIAAAERYANMRTGAY